MKTMIVYDDVFLRFLIIEFSIVIQFKVNWWSIDDHIDDCLFRL